MCTQLCYLYIIIIFKNNNNKKLDTEYGDQVSHINYISLEILVRLLYHQTIWIL